MASKTIFATRNALTFRAPPFVACKQTLSSKLASQPLYSAPFGSSRSSRLTSSLVMNTYPEPETEKERSPLDYPQEWLTPEPSRRPDIFPEFEKLETPLPKPMPGDPEQPEDEEEEDKKKKEEPEEDPEEKPEEPAPSEE
uniref:Uncharacterized protein n=1 Tax=Tetraselmis sp. GSL018 TaxID=582737 RepID=A0A061QW22_9CHLO|eukprot:CAMPEP_0177606458 /NCGR_PEP_ID=MMETSP0419_2-20121207/17319_1 /TAXON_ID=582737 /ORGANISM="Tetraselmis sp., Strain GSL018" /LENGTH=139 /DNA_ID=CAMNT_0019100823 /DNA_START=146 /DNA_END=565 /DNA_ORIENTATION=+